MLMSGCHLVSWAELHAGIVLEVSKCLAIYTTVRDNRTVNTTVRRNHRKAVELAHCTHGKPGQRVTAMLNDRTAHKPNQLEI